ncbi:copper chaperone PCu(A)C [Saccharomonospora saliphila]|uniref:copper chaperone PCu(A)C n=1 Tax=Saccharomonospora saliphila TaxID=369829 RepID=UPI00037A436C|nr:copper chaperone PCu(A)C [Saccharomonospora saliphila]
MVSSAVVAAGAALLVAGCAAGQITQTDTQVASINGARAEVGDIAVRNAELAYPSESGADLYRAGTDAGAQMWLVNEGLRGDRLVSIESDAASRVVVEGSRRVPAEGTLVLSRAESVPEQQVKTNATLTFAGLTRQLRPGEQIEVTLTFREAGRVSFEMPVTVPDQPRTDPGGSHGEGGGH